jgi:HD-GYP domain-containing protein (c-di-GMP phosphodiesterase class II)
MVRLADVLPGGKGPQKPGTPEVPTPESPPEVLILTAREEVVDLVRSAVEERGWRIHRAGSAEEVLERLRLLTRVRVVLDGRHEGTAGLIDHSSLESRTWIVLVDKELKKEGYIQALPEIRRLDPAVDPQELFERLQPTSLPPARTEPGRVFTSPATAPRPVTEPATSPVMPPAASSSPRPAAGIAPQPATPPRTLPPRAPIRSPTPPPTGTTAPRSTPAASPASAPRRGLYESAVAAVVTFLKGHRNRSNPPLNEIAEAVTGLIAGAHASNELYLQMIEHRPEFKDVDLFLAYHQVNTAILVNRIGSGRRLPDQELFELSLAAAIHDVGMTRLPEGLISRPGKLDQSGYSQIKQHSAYGRDIVNAYAGAYPWLPQVIYQEHERYDGSGYPDGLKGEAIHRYAQIIGLADTYEALTHPRTFREGMIPFNVLQQIIRLGGRLFPSELVKVFIQEISVFPLGSNVRLSTGEVGTVVGINLGYPLRPLVQILFSSTGVPLEEEEREVDLKQEPMIYITGPVDPREKKPDAGG